jgi:hypothetical protein
VAGGVALAAAVGAGLGCAVLVGSFLVVGLVPCHAGGFGCLGYVVPIVIGALTIAAIAAWPILHALRVRPALPVAVGGPLAAAGIGCLFARASSDDGGLMVTGLFAGPALGYGIAAFAAAGAVRLRWRVAVLVAVAALVPLAGVARTDQPQSAHDHEITGAGVPLLAPDLPGYDIRNAHADPYARTLSYELTPRDLPATASDYERAGRAISVHVAPVPPRFAPPARCNRDEAYRPDQPCAPAGPEVWRRTTDGPEVDYLARRGAVLVDVAQGGGFIDEALLRRAVAGMAPRPAAEFRPR